MIFSVTSPCSKTFQTLPCNNCDKQEFILFTLLFHYYLTCLHNLHWGYAILVQGKPGHCLMVMHSWSRAPQYFDCSPESRTEPETTGSEWLREAGWSNCTHHTTAPSLCRLSHSEVWTAPPAYSRPETLCNPRVHISYQVAVFFSSRQEKQKWSPKQRRLFQYF